MSLGLVAPIPYSLASSSLGLHLLYARLNIPGRMRIERVVSDVPAEGPPLTLEGGRHLGELDALLVSLSFELDITALASLLLRAGIPPLRRERGPHDPLVVVGGALTFANPRPLAALADVVVVGEVDDLLGSLADALELLPDESATLEALGALPHVWLPERSSVPPPPGRASLEQLPVRSVWTTPLSKLPDKHLVEVARSCPRRCGFCMVAGSFGRFRPVPLPRILEAIPPSARKLGLVGAAVTDHPGLKELMAALLDDGREVALSSVRADRLDDDLGELLSRAGYRTLTVAADGMSQRLRDHIHKGIDEATLLEAAALADRHGMRRIKLYQMIGLPGETDDDIDEFVRLVDRMRRIVPLTITVSPFVPKASTPLAEAAVAPDKLLERRVKRLRRGIGSTAKLSIDSIGWARVQAAIALGDESTGVALVEAARAGGALSAHRRVLPKTQSSR